MHALPLYFCAWAGTLEVHSVRTCFFFLPLMVKAMVEPSAPQRQGWCSIRLWALGSLGCGFRFKSYLESWFPHLEKCSDKPPLAELSFSVCVDIKKHIGNTQWMLVPSSFWDYVHLAFPCADRECHDMASQCTSVRKHFLTVQKKKLKLDVIFQAGNNRCCFNNLFTNT